MKCGMKSKFLIMGICLVFSLYSCDNKNDILIENKEIPIRFSIVEREGTRSLPVSGDNEISGIHIFFYDDEGRYVADEYLSAPMPSSISLNICKGHKYTIYAAANLGRLPDDAFYPSAVNIAGGVWNYDSTVMPMFGGIRDAVLSETTTLEIPMERLVSRFRIKIDTTGLDDGIKFDLKKVELKNLNGKVKFSGGSKALSSEDIIPSGESFAGDALENIYNGGLDFCLPENAQGDLLHDNNDEKTHIPPSPYDDLCTYIEFTVDYRSRERYDENLKYRYYLHDGSRLDNFDILRNTFYCCTTYFNGDGINENTWRIDVSGMKDLVTSIDIVPSSHIFQSYGETKKFTAAVYPPTAFNNQVTWSSSDERVATVDRNGLVTSVSDGHCTIMAKSCDGTDVSACADVTVDSEIIPESISVIPAKVEIYENASVRLEASISPGNSSDKSVSWTSSDTNIASVDADGLVTGRSIGRCRIIARMLNYPLESYSEVTVKENTFSILNFPDVLYPNYNTPYEIQFVAEPMGDPSFNIEAVSGDRNAVSIENGKVNAVNRSKKHGEIGKYRLNAELNGRIVNENFRVDAGTIEIDTTFLGNIYLGKSYNMKTSCIFPEDAKVRWRVNRTKIAAVNSSTGFLVPQSAGVVKVTATSVTGAYDEANVTVKRPPLLVRHYLNIYEGESKALIYQSIPGIPVAFRLAEGKENISLDENGNIKGLKRTVQDHPAVVNVYYDDSRLIADMQEVQIFVYPAVEASLVGDNNKLLNNSDFPFTSDVAGYPVRQQMDFSHSPNTSIYWKVLNPDGMPTGDLKVSSDGEISAGNNASGIYKVFALDGSRNFSSDTIDIEVYKYVGYILGLIPGSERIVGNEIEYTCSVNSKWCGPAADFIAESTGDNTLKDYRIIGYPSNTSIFSPVAVFDPGHRNSPNIFLSDYVFSTSYNPELNIWDNISPVSYLRIRDNNGQYVPVSGMKGGAVKLESKRQFYYVRQESGEFYNKP